jgi:very-short-patch-repair endonuclease
MQVTTALVRLGGVADRRSLRKLVTARQLAAAVESGVAVRLRRGLYAVADVDAAYAIQHRIGGVLSHESAALAWGWKVKKPPEKPVLMVPRNRFVDEVAVEVRYADLQDSEVVEGKTSRVRTVLDCARMLPFDRALCVADSALREGVVTREQLLAAARFGPRTYRRKAVQVIEAASAKAANPFESVLRAIALDVPGLVVEPQCPVGDVGKADVGDPVLRIVAEAESWEWHGVKEAFLYDVRRYTAMVRLGWLVVRFTWDDVMHKPEYVRAVLLDLVRLRDAEAA